MFKNHPKGLIPAALSNMGERFGYYIMNAVLVLFLCSKFGLSGDTAALIYSFFYAGIYILSLVGGAIADKTQNYKGTIINGLIIMTAGYAILAVPILATPQNSTWLLTLTCAALFLIAFGNGLFKGNLQAIVGQLYDNPRYSSQRDSGFQIFYVFINIGGLVAPFVAPMLRSWWLDIHGMTYNADFPEMCHSFLSLTGSMTAENMDNLYAVASAAGHTAGADLRAFCSQYLDVFNTGIHYSFIASVAAMILSLVIFIATKKALPSPAAHEKVQSVQYSPEEKQAMAKEIRQRMYALFAVLGIVIFFWFSFHQNGTSLSLFARDFVATDTIAPEIWQAVNPFFVIVLTPLVMMLFHSQEDSLRHGSCRHRLPFPVRLLLHPGLSLRRRIPRHVGSRQGRPQSRPMGAHSPLFLPHCGRTVHLPPRPVVRLQSGSKTPPGPLPGPLARRHRRRQPPPVDRPADVQQMAHILRLGRLPCRMPRVHGRHVRHGEMARTHHRLTPITTRRIVKKSAAPRALFALFADFG